MLPHCRALVKPWELGSLDDAFGLLDLPEVRHVGEEKGPRAHVLVCAPSNSALDEIVMRILQNGLMDRCIRSARLWKMLLHAPSAFP